MTHDHPLHGKLSHVLIMAHGRTLILVISLLNPFFGQVFREVASNF